MEKTASKKSQTVDLVYLVRVLRSHILWILAVTLCAGVLFGGIRLFVHTNDYETQVKFIINGFTATDEGIKVNVAQTSSGNNFAHSFPDLLKSNRSMTAALIQLRDDAAPGESFDGFTTEDIRGMISRVSVDNQVVTVHIRHSEKQTAYSVAKAIEKTIPAVVDYYLGINNTSTLETRTSIVKVLNGPADVGVERTGMGVMTFMALGGVIGFVIAFFIFFLRDYFDTALYSEKDLKTIFPEASIIGQIPTWETVTAASSAPNVKKTARLDAIFHRKPRFAENLKREYEGRLLSTTSPFALSEAFKLLRTNLLYTTKGETCAVYAVTSAYIGAGKSVITANTAISFAQMGKRVLVIDGDLRCPAQQSVFKLSKSGNGLSEALAGVCRIDEVNIQKDRFPGLDVLTSGRIPPNPAELLASERMGKLMNYLRARYDVIFIDLPPVCQVSDAGAISDIVTGYAFVVRAAVSDRRVVATAVETMKGYGASIIGFILNDVDIKTGDYYKTSYSSYGKHGYDHRGYRYGSYGYGSGSSYDTRGKRDVSYPSASKKAAHPGEAPAPDAVGTLPEKDLPEAPVQENDAESREDDMYVPDLPHRHPSDGAAPEADADLTDGETSDVDAAADADDTYRFDDELN